MKRENNCWSSSSYQAVLVLALLCLASGCGPPLPRQYIQQAEPGVILTTLTAAPDRYREKVVILGGVVVEERQEGGRFWLRLKNRPLDEDYHPRLPGSMEGPETGYYWLTAAHRSDLPERWRNWARMTVVGRVVGARRVEGQPVEPVLTLLYVRGWGLSSSHDGSWEESIDASYLPSVPESIQGELGGAR